MLSFSVNSSESKLLLSAAGRPKKRIARVGALFDATIRTIRSSAAPAASTISGKSSGPKKTAAGPKARPKQQAKAKARLQKSPKR